jgi:uncharacterized protein YkuJ
MPGRVDSESLAVSLGDCLGLKSTIALAEIVQEGNPDKRTDKFRREGTSSCEVRQAPRNRTFEQQRLYDSCHVCAMMRQRQSGYFDPGFVGA